MLIGEYDSFLYKQGNTIEILAHNIGDCLKNKRRLNTSTD